MSGPDRFPVVPGTPGLRKIRFADSRSNRGKRGSYRAYFGYFPDHGIVVLFTLYGKNEKSDLTAAGRKAATAIMIEIAELLEQGRIR